MTIFIITMRSRLMALKTYKYVHIEQNLVLDIFRFFCEIVLRSFG